MVTRDEARWELIEAAKLFTASQNQFETIESLPQALIEGKSIKSIVAPLTVPQFLEQLETVNKAWTRYYKAWLAFTQFPDK